MIYLDYSATTPVSYDVLESYIRATKDFMGNPNSIHSLGVKSKALMHSAIKQISDIFSVLESEITFTSGATMSNNLALIGTALANMKYGNHILVSKLEHPSIYSICKYLENIGFEIGYIDNTSDGLVDFDKLKKQIRDDTILVSVCAVNSEMGVRQPLKMIRQIIKKENPHTFLHSDMTQALGKVAINLHDVDLASMTAHKIYGPKGIGLFYKNSRVPFTPLLYGSGSVNMYNPGTPPVPLIVAFSKAIRLATVDLDKRENFIKRLNIVSTQTRRKQLRKKFVYNIVVLLFVYCSLIPIEAKRNRIRQLKELMDSISTNDEFFKSNPQITSVNNFFNKLIDKLAEEC